MTCQKISHAHQRSIWLENHEVMFSCEVICACLDIWMAIRHAVVYYARAAHAFSAGNKCWHSLIRLVFPEGVSFRPEMKWSYFYLQKGAMLDPLRWMTGVADLMLFLDWWVGVFMLLHMIKSAFLMRRSVSMRGSEIESQMHIDMYRQHILQD